MSDNTISAEATKPTKKKRRHAPLSPFLEENFFTTAGAAAALSMSKRNFCAMMARGEAPPRTRIGRRVLFRKQAVEHWLASLEEKKATTERKRA